MRDSGADTIKLPVWFGRYDGVDDNHAPLPAKDCPTSDPFAAYPQHLSDEYPGQGFVGEDYRLTGWLLNSSGGHVSPNCKQSIGWLLQTIKNKGFKEVLVDFAPTGGSFGERVGNSPTSFPSDWLKGAGSDPGGVHCDMAGYPPLSALVSRPPAYPADAVDYFNENYSFIVDFIQNILMPSGLQYRVDLGGETMPGYNGAYQPNLAYYVQFFWQRFIQQFGTTLQNGVTVSTQPTVGFSYGAPADASEYTRTLPCMYGPSGAIPPSLAFHLYDNAYNILTSIQKEIHNPSDVPASYIYLPEINGETLYNDPINANSHNQSLSEAGLNGNPIPLQYLTAWFYNAVPPGVGPTTRVPEEPRPAPTDSSKYDQNGKGW